MSDLTHELDWPHRQYWVDPNMDTDEYRFDGLRNITVSEGANLVSSRTTSGKHAPALDIDYAARLVPSRTPGHFHLYLDHLLPWWKYRVLLKVLAWCGIIEKGYYRASVSRKQTFLRRKP